jgi:hypothetical protein
VQNLDVFMAGDDVPKKKPDPSIYRIGAERLQLAPAECLVIEDSTIGLKVCLLQAMVLEEFTLLLDDVMADTICHHVIPVLHKLHRCCMPRWMTLVNSA